MFLKKVDAKVFMNEVTISWENGLHICSTIEAPFVSLQHNLWPLPALTTNKLLINKH